MKIPGKISQLIKGYNPGEVFTFSDLQLKPEESTAGIKALSRMVKDGMISRAGTGKYYKPNRTPFGDLKPAEDELLRTYLFKDGKRIAYVTGLSLYNRLGLTTQVPRTIQVASRDKRIITKIGSLKVKAVKSYVDVSDDNYRILGLLDAIKDFKDIPDRNTGNGLLRLKQLLSELSTKDLRELVKASLSYPPRARALAGALLDAIGVNSSLINPLAQSLNPLSAFNFALSKNVLPTADKWRVN